MNNTINSDLIRGNINTIILKALFEGDRYGYDIIKEIEQKSSGQYILKQPTLYSCLKRLEVQGFIRSYWGARSSGGRRKYYTLTDMGRELFLKSQTEWEYSRTVIDRLISDREADLNSAERAYALQNTKPPVETDTTAFDESAYDSMEENDEELMRLLAEAEELEKKDRETESLQEQPAESKTESCYPEETDPDAEKLKESFYSEAKSDNETGTDESEIDEREYIDTSKVLDKYFQKEEDDSEDDSYAEKLVGDSYDPTPQKKCAALEENDYGDFEDLDENIYTENESIEEFPADTAPPAPIPASAEERNGFISYDTKFEHAAADNEKAILERDYRGVLGKLVAGQTTAVPEAAMPPPNEIVPVDIPRTPQMTAAEEAADRMLTTTGSPQAAPAASAGSFARKYNDLSSSFRELGDNIFVREHSLSPGREQSGKVYYYQYRLMQKQFVILTAIMLFMIVASFLIVRVGFRIITTLDIAVYFLSITMAFIFFITGLILNYRYPDRKTRIRYNFKTALVYRIILFLGCLIIIYSINLILEMPATMSLTHLCPLLLPSLLALCLPLSTVIFNLLYGTGKYNA